LPETAINGSLCKLKAQSLKPKTVCRSFINNE
jgi:hypothetical protein